jgi:hypothetical protein
MWFILLFDSWDEVLTDRTFSLSLQFIFFAVKFEQSSILILLESCLQTCMAYTIAECTVNNS